MLRLATTFLVTVLFGKVFLQVLLLRLIACEEDNGTADGIRTCFQNKMRFQVNLQAIESVNICEETNLAGRVPLAHAKRGALRWIL